MHCRFDLDKPPHFEIEPDIANDRFYCWVERHWMAQQLAVAIPLFLLGGIGFVLWGVCLRVTISLNGHWIIGHLAHSRGHQGWIVTGLPVQGFNLRGLGLIAFGENWHSNHHAFPHSARLGIEKGQLDPGFWFISFLKHVGLAYKVLGPSDHPEREGLIRADRNSDTPTA